MAAFIRRWLASIGLRYDIFLSYSRQDGQPYTAALRDALTERGYFCFLDKDEAPAGAPLENTLTSALRKSATLVLVGSPAAADSPYVQLELEHFRHTDRDILPIRFRGQGSLPPPLLESHIIWIDESDAALASGHPSDTVVNTIDNRFALIRRTVRSRLRTTLSAITAVVAVVVIVLMAREYQRRQSDRIASESLNSDEPRQQLERSLAAFQARNTPLAEAALLQAAARWSSWTSIQLPAGTPSIKAIPRFPGAVLIIVDNMVATWDIGSGRLVEQRLAGPVIGASSDGTTVMFVGATNALTVANRENPFGPFASFEDIPGTRQLSGTISDGGRWLATWRDSGDKSSVTVWKSTPLEQVATFVVSGRVDALAFDVFHRDRMVIGYSQRVEFWDLRVPAGRVYRLPVGDVTRVRFGTDDRVFLSFANRSSGTMNWKIGALLTPTPFADFNLWLSDNGRYSARSSTDDGRSIAIWDVAKGERLGSERHRELFIDSVWLSNDGSTAVIHSEDGMTVVRGLSDETMLDTLRDEPSIAPDLLVLPNGYVVLARSGKAMAWRPAGFASKTIDLNINGTGWSLSNDGSQLLVNGEGGFRNVFSTSTGRVVARQPPETGASIGVRRILVSTNNGFALRTIRQTEQQLLRAGEGDHIVASSIDAKGTFGAELSSNGSLVFWDAFAGAVVFEDKRSRDCGFISVAPAGDAVATVCHDNIYTWRLADRWMAALTLEVKNAFNVFFGRDVLVVSSGNGTVEVRNREDGELRYIKRTGEGLVGARVLVDLPRTRRIAVGTDAGVVHVWDKEDGNDISLRGHSGGVHSLITNPTETCIASAADDGAIRVWHSSTGRLLATMRGSRIQDLRFVENASRLISVSADARLSFYSTPFCMPVDDVYETANSVFSRIAFAGPR